MKTGVTIIECLDADDPGSEGRGLRHLFDLMEVKSTYIKVTSIVEMVETIAGSNFKYVHVSTHGVVDSETESFYGWWSHRGTGNRRNLEKFEGKIKCRAIVSTACNSGAEGFGNYVVNSLGSKYYIGPKGGPKYYNAMLFAHIFYHKLFITESSVRKAFKSYDDSYRNPHGFRLYERK